MSIPGESFFKLSNAVFCYDLTPFQLTVYAYLVSRAGQREKGRIDFVDFKPFMEVYQQTWQALNSLLSRVV